MQGREKLYFINFYQTQEPFAIECLKKSPVDFCILGLIGIILVIFILSALTAIIILLLNLGLTTFSVISDTFNGLIDLGVPEGVNILHFSAKSGNTKGYSLCSYQGWAWDGTSSPKDFCPRDLSPKAQNPSQNLCPLGRQPELSRDTNPMAHGIPVPLPIPGSYRNFFTSIFQVAQK